MTRRSLLALAPTVALANQLDRTSAHAQTPSSDVSGGIGLTRAEWEAAFGAGEATDVPDAMYDAIFTYGTETGTLFVGYADTKPGGEDEAAAMFVEVAFWAGVPFDEAERVATAFLPADAELAGSPFIGPPTPGGPMSLDIRRYTSEWLATVPYGNDVTLNPDVLVAYHALARDSDPGTQPMVYLDVTRVSIMCSIPIG